MAGAPNFANRTLWTRGNLDVLRGLNSESIDLVYADPPFNSNKNYQAPVARIGPAWPERPPWFRGRGGSADGMDVDAEVAAAREGARGYPEAGRTRARPVARAAPGPDPGSSRRRL